MAGSSRDDSVEVCKRSDTGSLVQDDKQGRIEGPARRGGLFEGSISTSRTLAVKPRSQPLLVPSRGATIKGVAPPERSLAGSISPRSAEEATAGSANAAKTVSAVA